MVVPVSGALTEQSASVGSTASRGPLSTGVDLDQPGGPEALEDRRLCPMRVWNWVRLENSFLPGGLEAQTEAVVAHDSHRRYHENLDDLTPADVSFGRGQAILKQRKRIKRQTIQSRRLQHQRQVA
ncbi:hypothetical protein GR304_19370 [Microvirga sp. SYSU G3D207]|nr:hypothetical protein [Microvirga arsenatis]